MKHYVKICLVLMLVCGVMTGILAAVNTLTQPLILKSREAKTNEALAGFFPTMTATAPLDESEAAVTALKGVYEGTTLLGYAAEATTKGYAGDVTIMVGIAGNGTLLGVRIISHSETKGLSEASEADALASRFVGKTTEQKLTANGGEIDGIAGATYSSRAVLDGVNAAVRAVNALDKEDGVE